MAYTKSFLQRPAEPIKRVLRPSDVTNQTTVLDCPDKVLKEINDDLDLKNDLGIYLDEDGKVPESAGIPRIFVMGLDKDGRDRRMSLEEAGVRYGSREFWQQAQQGNVFALPAGEATPVQLTVTRTKSSASVSIRPVGVDKLPEAQLKRPTRWQRFVHFFNRNKYAEEINRWANREANSKANREMMASMFEKRRKVLKDEMDELRDREAEEALAQAEKKEAGRLKREQQQKERQLSDIHVQAVSKTQGRQTYRDLVAPEPVFRKELERTKEKQGFYSKESFGTLKKLEHSYSEYQVGGKPVTEDEYCGLVAACSVLPEHAEEGFKKLPAYDPQMKAALLNGGHTEEQSREIIAHSYMTMATIDLMKAKLHNNQDNLLETNVNAGRTDTIQALEKYKNGDKDELARVIAYGVKHTAAFSGQQLNTVSDEYHNLFHFSSAAAGLMERDPALRELAEEKYGMKPDDLRALKGLAALDKADTARRTAKEKLAKAAEGKLTLNRDEKRQCAKDILKANFMEASLTTANAMLKGKGQRPADREEDRLADAAEKNKLMRADKETRPLPPKGLYYYDQIVSVIPGRQPEFNAHPKTILGMDKEGWQKNYEMIADKILDADKLDELDARALHEAINSKSYANEEIMTMGSRVLKDEAPRVDPLTETMNVEKETEKIQREGLQL